MQTQTDTTETTKASTKTVRANALDLARRRDQCRRDRREAKDARWN